MKIVLQWFGTTYQGFGKIRQYLWQYYENVIAILWKFYGNIVECYENIIEVLMAIFLKCYSIIMVLLCYVDVMAVKFKMYNLIDHIYWFCRFVTFDLESSTNCASDSIQIFDGPTSQSPIMGTFCGNAIPSLRSSKSGQLYIVFKSNSFVQGRGFQAYFRKTGKVM